MIILGIESAMKVIGTDGEPMAPDPSFDCPETGTTCHLWPVLTAPPPTPELIDEVRRLLPPVPPPKVPPKPNPDADHCILLDGGARCVVPSWARPGGLGDRIVLDRSETPRLPAKTGQSNAKTAQREPGEVPTKPPAQGRRATVVALPVSYDAEEAGRIIGQTKNWMMTQARKGLIPHTRVGRKVRFTPQHLAEILRAGEQRPRA